MAPWLIWIAMAALAAVAAVPLLAPLYRARATGGVRGAQALAIYRDQLAELDRDVASGSIAVTDADAARTEIARRLLRAGAETDTATPSPTRARRVAVAAAVVIAMPVAALGLYLWLGSPQHADQPLLARQPAADDVATLVAAVEARLQEAPEDGRGWDVLAPVYLRLGRSSDAAQAYTNAIRLLGSSAEREIGLGEAISGMNGGTVTADANAAFTRANALAPGDPRPRFYLALGMKQAGNDDAAATAWRALLADAPPGAPWAAIVQQQLAALDAAPVPAPPGTPGPTAEDVVAAGDMTPEDRQAMIEGMVASLATRLESQPADSEGWSRLVRSYMVLDRPDDARAALAKARLALAGNADGLAAVEAVARETGVEASP